MTEKEEKVDTYLHDVDSLSKASVMVSFDPKDLTVVKSVCMPLSTIDERAFWIDWDGMPPSEEWTEEIYKAIEQSDVFLCFLSPDYIQSEKCKGEVEHALKTGKKIVVVVCGDLEPQDVRKELASLKWIVFRATEDLENALKLVSEAVDSDLYHTHIHTKILQRARQWEKLIADKSLLFSGKDLQRAKDWVSAAASHTETHPTKLQLSFIATCDDSAKKMTEKEEKKEAETYLNIDNNSDDVKDKKASLMISFDPKDLTVVKSVCMPLSTIDDRDLWADWDSMPPSEEWMAEVYKGIEQSDAFLCFLSPDYLQSEERKAEVEHALKTGKKIVVVVCGDLKPQDVRKELASLKWIVFRATEGEDFNNAVKLIEKAVDSDLSHTRIHTKILQRARQWEEHLRQEREVLLSGNDLQRAKDWLSAAASHPASPPTKLHLSFIATCDDATKNDDKKEVKVISTNSQSSSSSFSTASTITTTTTLSSSSS
eukprot:TRINITY_DN171_c0_g1_i1.p1 TRINITY_DN171_c0_g1~~TRINITY_DN171_c0_g1_i1.p1  ORF type:complete len:484 (+),score=112.90 TRINITY_DN171_c0_g1_i1:23-1474(+)